jgi:hypothetical protein
MSWLQFRKKLLHERADAISQIKRITKRERHEDYMAVYRAEFDYLIGQWEEVVIELEKRLVTECESCSGTIIPDDLSSLHYYPERMCGCDLDV